MPGLLLKVQWEPFFLNSSTPEEGEDLFEHITKKYGPDMARRFSGPDNPLTAAGRKVGIAFNPARRLIPTVRCHVVMDHVNANFGIDKGNDLMKILFRKYFEEALNVNDRTHLVDACVELFGSDSRSWVTPLLEDKARADEIRAKDRNVKTALRVSGVPFFIIGANQFSGAQPPEMLAEVLQEAIDA